MRRLRFFTSVLVGVLAAAVLTPARADGLLRPWSSVGVPPPPWHVVGLPQQTKPYTRFSIVDLDGKHAVRIEAESSYANLVHAVAAQSGSLHLAWAWRIEKPLEHADLRQKSGDDTAVRVCAFFDEPMEAVPFIERQLFRIAQSRSAEPLPTATLCYVWDAQLPVGTVLPSPFTRRVRYVVLESGRGAPDRWVVERRDLVADFRRAFGDEIANVPAVIGVAVGGDADNTHGHSIAYVADVSLEH